jgi:hypothetical protein
MSCQAIEHPCVKIVAHRQPKVPRRRECDREEKTAHGEMVAAEPAV